MCDTKQDTNFTNLIAKFDPENTLRPKELNNLQTLAQNPQNTVLIGPYKNHRLYYQTLAFVKDQSLTLVLMPTAGNIQEEMGYLQTLNLDHRAAALTSDLYPNQARRLLVDVAAGTYQILYLTPESFLYWFKPISELQINIVIILN